MKKLSKTKQEEIRKLGKAAERTHMLTLQLKEELSNMGLDNEFITDNINSLLIGDINSSDFIDYVQEELDYLYN